MATRAPLREHEPSREEHESHHHHLLDVVEDWAEETGLDPEGEPGEGVPWHVVLLILVGVALLFALEMTLVYTITKIVTGRA
jgi:hypothetical protein